ncbi:MAG: arsenite methyltransferase [Syntrophothermus sp.]|uniref:arsenite methyltransferase n=1 Tax=Syntrophothermus sp. TaxID=2736299 RepID=UPI00257B1CC8|nr:arsenite methyltransferase [Syntrophothermus sp.]NSW82638.1 arsenite methyltransferase [Syntrophothermus sp.]
MEKDIRQEVREFYGRLAEQAKAGTPASCCSSGSCCTPIANAIVLYDLDKLENLPREAVNFSLGCANPLLLADLKEGEVVLDLGSGGGLDVLAASKYVGPSGKVYGLDMTDEMLALANRNKEQMGVTNVEFLKGFIEDIPLPDDSCDVVMSNCVINLSPDKEKALAEVYRVLKPQGRLCIADIVSVKPVPESARELASLWVSCIAGALDVKEYENILKKVGFKDIEVQPVIVYQGKVLEDIAGGSLKNLSESEVAELDGAFASAYVKARK